jgi:hypothetical protein
MFISGRMGFAMNKQELKSYIMEGRYGVTKHQMIPAIQNNIDNKDVIKALYKYYPDTFSTCVRYLHKKEKEMLLQYFKKDVSTISQEKMELINILKPSKKGISMRQIIQKVEESVSAGDINLTMQIRLHFPEYFERSRRYIKRSINEKIDIYLKMNELAKRKGKTAMA